MESDGWHNDETVADYREDWDLTTIPKEVFYREVRRRQVTAPRPGRRILRPCPHCGAMFPTRELKDHKPLCEKNPRVQRILAAQKKQS